MDLFIHNYDNLLFVFCFIYLYIYITITPLHVLLWQPYYTIFASISNKENYLLSLLLKAVI